MGRTLRSKKLRSLLYYSQDGKCANCGCNLPDDWHADHIIPYVVTTRTNVHDMQALCPICNWEKGSKMLRKHQSEIQKVARDIRTGIQKASNILAHVTPGGGKSAIAMILAKELAEPLGYKICWVVPRDALRAQGESDFVNTQKRSIFGHTTKIRAAGNDTRPARDEIGYVTTYQAIAQNPDLHLDEFRLRPYILILDECHHVPDKGEADDSEEAAYFKAIAPLVEYAKIRVFASGTLERHDGHKIAFLPYKPFINCESVDLDPRQNWAVIRYQRKDALEEKAIVPLHFYAMDGKAKWFDPKTNEERNVDSIAEAELRHQPAVLQTVLETKMARDILDRCANDWQGHKQVVYPRAKMLVIAPNINTANEYCKHLSSYGARIATSQDTQQAKDNIQLFKKNDNHVNVLVTVGMAYEGLDVPEITHVACLTNIRSRPWVEQAICRANRSDHSHGKTHGYIYYPDDPRMKKIMDSIEAEQAALVANWPPRKEPAPKSSGIGSDSLPIVPLVSAATGARTTGLEDGTRTTYNETKLIEDSMKLAKITGISVVQFKQALVHMGLGVVPNGTADEPNYDENVLDDLPPSEMEDRLRKSIDRIIKRIAKGDGQATRQINIEIRANFGPRERASVATLKLIMRYLTDIYDAKV
jgi:superfamily II DNA or RNA helicase